MSTRGWPITSVYYKTAQGKVRHGIYDAIAGTVGGSAKPNPRGIYATLKEATANKHMPKGETDVDEDEVRTGGGGVKSDEESDDEAWKSAMHTMHYLLHYLYANRHAGIGYTSDGNREPIAWYDSGHMQDRVDYKSQYGYVIMWFGGPLCWISKKHNHVRSTGREKTDRL